LKSALEIRAREAAFLASSDAANLPASDASVVGASSICRERETFDPFDPFDSFDSFDSIQKSRRRVVACTRKAKRKQNRTFSRDVTAAARYDIKDIRANAILSG